MTELHDPRTLGVSDRDSMPYSSQTRRGYEAPFDSPIPAGRTYDYDTLENYQASYKQEHGSSTPLLQRHCDEDSPMSTSDTIEPFYLNTFQQDRPQAAFDDSRRNGQHRSVGQNFHEALPLQPSAYYLDDNFHTFDQRRFSSTSNFGSPHIGIHQPPYTDSSTPLNGCPSPIITWSRVEGDVVEGSSRGEGATFKRQNLEEDDGNSDKPYARLIWEALMHTPGHRMMLREIYAWFQCNTNKARESGSNGWQNSIRHNLSMNQAFENDKSEGPVPQGQGKKANSVWVLTESAIRDGVQSTTRYRKTGSGKKTHAGRTPAPLRQRSGARGGRAARRAAKLRRNEQDYPSESLSFPGIPSPPNSYASLGVNGTCYEADYESVHTPTTPINDPLYSFSAAYAIPTFPTEMPLFYNSEEDYTENPTSVQHEFVMQPQKDPCSERTERFPFGSNPQEISM